MRERGVERIRIFHNGITSFEASDSRGSNLSLQEVASGSSRVVSKSDNVHDGRVAVVSGSVVHDTAATQLLVGTRVARGTCAQCDERALGSRIGDRFGGGCGISRCAGGIDRGGSRLSLDKRLKMRFAAVSLQLDTPRCGSRQSPPPKTGSRAAWLAVSRGKGLER
jgi:hypothetical protein